MPPATIATGAGGSGTTGSSTAAAGGGGGGDGFGDLESTDAKSRRSRAAKPTAGQLAAVRKTVEGCRSDPRYRAGGPAVIFEGDRSLPQSAFCEWNAAGPKRGRFDVLVKVLIDDEQSPYHGKDYNVHLRQFNKLPLADAPPRRKGKGKGKGKASSNSLLAESDDEDAGTEDHDHAQSAAMVIGDKEGEGDEDGGDVDGSDDEANACTRP